MCMKMLTHVLMGVFTYSFAEMQRTGLGDAMGLTRPSGQSSRREAGWRCQPFLLFFLNSLHS